ncbi:hypothetical protein FDP41_013659 [Naegleria fowleri]|uniref:Uncharacterized protein n=1 Tax=Naegleria fowleri TaxID=5763 RepID=A0A6A5C4P8_NAEFO|nr:uncharacterized protein FDP41_013659 [Naegleria fowleri]KAF0980445.1 hypothetical protein FDP41_013659 [Naegleria fowleri]CAG4714596.1 unnamed protein product [Naegleria fowleri]
MSRQQEHHLRIDTSDSKTNEATALESPVPLSPISSPRQAPSPLLLSQASYFIHSLHESHAKLSGHSVLLSQQEIQRFVLQFLSDFDEKRKLKLGTSTTISDKEQELLIQVFNKKLANMYKEEGNLYLKKKRYATSVDLYIASCLIAPDQPIYYSNLAAALYFCKRFQESERACEIAIMLDPQYGKAYSRLAKVKETLNKFDEAIKNYERAIELETSQTVRESIIQQRNELLSKIKK